ncbi:MAG: tetratricopeptide repeat protein [Pseudoprimorskyibacter sp.]|nr:tetratricopeptide repeat protein [Pseudoprimorskyibacter sp.]
MAFRFWTLTTAFVVAFGAAPANLAADGFAGPYLAARQASSVYDFDAAARYYARANLADPSDIQLMERAAISFFALGEVARSAQFSELLETAGQRDSQISNLVLATSLSAQGDWATLQSRFGSGQRSGPLTQELMQAWVLSAQGNQAAANDVFDALAQNNSMQPFAIYHKALSLALAGEDRQALTLLQSDGARMLMLRPRAIRLRAELLGRLSERQAALELLNLATQGQTADPASSALAALLKSGQSIALTEFKTPQQGIAEVFFNLAQALRNEAEPDLLLLYARAAVHLDPTHTDALLILAQVLEDLEQYDLAVDAYAQVLPTNPLYTAAEIGRADALQSAGKLDLSIDVLQDLAQKSTDNHDVMSALGDALRRADRFEDSAIAYSRAIELTSPKDPSAWFLYYVRAIAYERTGQWPQAEADFRRALELNPGQPQALNYLGYSLVQKQMKLDEALSMIQRAVAASPDSGYIIDSLGWVLYKLGRYDEAVPYMVRAAELMPIDPVVNDHLGDVLWAVGREREARFQWRRSLSFVNYGSAAEQVDPDRLRRKLDVGLDDVLANEGSPPLQRDVEP